MADTAYDTLGLDDAAGRLMTLAEVAKILKCSPRQVRRIVDSGELRVVRVGTSSRSDRVHPADLTTYINAERKARPRECPSTSAVIRGGFPSLSADAELESLLDAEPRGRKQSS